MMKQLFVVGLLIVGAAVASAQTNHSGANSLGTCTVTLARAPGAGGIRLGMTAEQVLSLFPGSNQDKQILSQLSSAPSRLGVASFSIRPEQYSSKSKFARINQISFKLINGRVSTFTVGYNGPQWSNVDEFVNRFYEGSNLPKADGWEAYVGMDTQLKILKCQGFEINVFAGGEGGNLNYVMMKDTVAEQKLKELRAKAREQKMKESRP
jgi:hypothetical protein